MDEHNEGNETSGSGNSILFSDLHPNDAVVVETSRSVYRFVVKDVAKRVGSLDGGRIDSPREAIAGGVVDGENNLDFFSDGLRPGGRAVFFLAAPTAAMGFDRVVTSGIERVYIDRSHADRRAA